MNTIRNYLESMFANLPNTPEVIRAKCELGQMMEDKYTELINDGKSDNEAVAQVISEFGNLEELADALGISQILNEQNQAMQKARQVSAEDAERYLDDSSHYALLHGLATFFAIISPCGIILTASAGTGSLALMAAGIFFLLGAIAACVTLHVYSSLRMGTWSFLKNEPCTIDYATAGMVNDLRRSTHDSIILQRTIAVLLFCTCYIPLVFLALLDKRAIASASGVIILLFMVALAVLLLTVSSSRVSSCSRLLDLSGTFTASGYSSAKSGRIEFTNPTVRAIMSVYWPTITCLYLIISFLTFTWAISWIIWPIAAVICNLLESIFGTKGESHE